MNDIVLPCLLVAGLIYAPIASAADYGVGFSLSLDYGVASVSFSNGSTVNVAKVEGGATYRQLMRSLDVFDGYRKTQDYIILDDNLQPGTCAPQALWGLPPLRHYLPPWFGGNDARTRSLSGMLRALNTAVGSYLEASSSTVEIVHPFPVSDDYLNTLRSACTSLSPSLHMPLSTPPPAGILAARAHGIGGKCTVGLTGEAPNQYDDPAQLILTVDYSRAALSAILVVEECGVFEYRRVLHDESLGTDALLRGSDRSNYGNLVYAIRNITNLPLEDGNGAGLSHLSALVMMGESAGNERLGNALKESLGEPSGALGAMAMAIDARQRKIDPLFAASNGAAQDCLDRLNSEYIDGRYDTL